MVKVGGYNIGDIYQGGYSSLDPDKGYGSVFTGYRVSAGSLGLTTDIRNANILQEVSSKLSTGVKVIEVSAVSPEVFESMPDNHLKELNKLKKLTGIDITLHGPIIEPSGLTREGFSETNREAAERQMEMVIDRSLQINPDGNSPVTFHSSAILPGEITQKDKKHPDETLIINSETGSINRLPLRQGAYPGEGEINVDKEVFKRNEEQWSTTLTHLGYSTERANELIHSSVFLKYGGEGREKEGKQLLPEEKQAKQYFNIGVNYLNDSYRELKELYNIAANIATKQGNVEDQKVLDEFSKKIEKKAERINDLSKKDKFNPEAIKLRQEIVEDGLEVLSKKISTPQMFQPLNDFAKKNTIKTFANVAFDSYSQHGDKSPIISIENPPAGGAFATGDELKQVVEASRELFVKRAVAEKGMSEKAAREQAEKLIGVTWDVGHINMLRKFGYKEEDIIAQTKKIAPLVKHIHLSDNFGFEHTELPMGMGTVPIKEIMEQLEKKDVKKIIEAGNWWQHFKTPPLKESMEAMGSPIYSMMMQPYWNQTLGLYQGYFGG